MTRCGATRNDVVPAVRPDTRELIRLRGRRLRRASRIGTMCLYERHVYRAVGAGVAIGIGLRLAAARLGTRDTIRYRPAASPASFA